MKTRNLVFAVIRLFAFYLFVHSLESLFTAVSAYLNMSRDPQVVQGGKLLAAGSIGRFATDLILALVLWSGARKLSAYCILEDE